MARTQLTPQEITDKQIANLSAATERIRLGVERTAESPMEKAAASLDKAADRYGASIRSGKMAARLRSVSLQEWKQLTIAKVDRISSGIQEASGKLIAFHEQLKQHQDSYLPEISRAPNRTPSDAEARMLMNLRKMREFSFRRST